MKYLILCLAISSSFMYADSDSYFKALEECTHQGSQLQDKIRRIYVRGLLTLMINTQDPQEKEQLKEKIQKTGKSKSAIPTLELLENAFAHEQNQTQKQLLGFLLRKHRQAQRTQNGLHSLQSKM